MTIRGTNPGSRREYLAIGDAIATANAQRSRDLPTRATHPRLFRRVWYRDLLDKTAKRRTKEIKVPQISRRTDDARRLFESASNLKRGGARLHPRSQCSFQFYNFPLSFSLGRLTGYRNRHRDRRSFIRRENHAVGTAEGIGSPDGFSERAQRDANNFVSEDPFRWRTTADNSSATR